MKRHGHDMKIFQGRPVVWHRPSHQGFQFRHSAPLRTILIKMHQLFQNRVVTAPGSRPVKMTRATPTGPALKILARVVVRHFRRGAAHAANRAVYTKDVFFTRQTQKGTAAAPVAFTVNAGLRKHQLSQFFTNRLRNALQTQIPSLRRWFQLIDKFKN